MLQLLNMIKNRLKIAIITTICSLTEISNPYNSSLTS